MNTRQIRRRTTRQGEQSQTSLGSKFRLDLTLQAHYVAGAGFELVILLPPPLEFWDYIHVRLFLFYTVLKTEPKASCVLGKCPTS